MTLDIFTDIEELNNLLQLLALAYPNSNITIHYPEINEQTNKGKIK